MTAPRLQLPSYTAVTPNLTMFGSRRPDHLAESVLCQEDACAYAGAASPHTDAHRLPWPARRFSGVLPGYSGVLTVP